MKEKFKKSDIEDYVLSHINGLQEILTRFNYCNLANFVKVLKTEFLWQSKVTTYLTKNMSCPDPIVIDTTDTQSY